MTAPPSPRSTAAKVEIVRAGDAALLSLAQHLRYSVMVGELGESPRGADHARRLIADELDDTGTTWVAFAGAQLAGTVRINRLEDDGVDVYFRGYELPPLGPAFAGKTIVVTRLISRSDRGTEVVGQLAGAVLNAVAASGARYIAIAVEPHLIAFYRSMGFTTAAGEPASPSASSVMTLMLFDFEDRRHREKKTLAGWLYPGLFPPPA
jgi:hypothetical protein